MKLKPEWFSYLHAIRTREIKQVFGRCPDNLFDSGLELGAGDGYQSGLLTRHVKQLVATDIHDPARSAGRLDAVEYRQCDAERVAAVFGERELDLVFSSNLLEHLPNPGAALRGVFKVLKDDGVTIHIMPSPLWKVCDVGLWYPDLVIRAFEVVFEPGRVSRFARRHLLGRDEQREAEPVLHWDPKDNPKMPMRHIGYWQQLLWPRPHGAYPSHWREILAYRRSRWRRELEAAGFEVRKILPGPVSSGYGFGLDRVRVSLERLGVATEWVFVATKTGARSPYVEYF